jgi:hypothetical protein
MFGGFMRPWESVSRQTGSARRRGTPGGEARQQGSENASSKEQTESEKGDRSRCRAEPSSAGAGARVKGQAKRSPAGFVCADASGKASDPAGLGFVRIPPPRGFVRLRPLLPATGRGSMRDGNSTPFPPMWLPRSDLPRAVPARDEERAKPVQKCASGGGLRACG